MPSFGPESERQLATCSATLQKLFREVVKRWDCKVLEGKRSQAQQVANVAKGVSKTLDSKHVTGELPSEAADVAPFPLKWPVKPKDQTPKELHRWMKEMAAFYYFAGYVQGTADQMGIALRYGGDWNGNRSITDQDFDDLVHFELRGTP